MRGIGGAEGPRSRGLERFFIYRGREREGPLATPGRFLGVPREAEEVFLFFAVFAGTREPEDSRLFLSFVSRSATGTPILRRLKEMGGVM